MNIIIDGKVVNQDNEVLIIISPGFGAGWSSWNRSYPECLYDADCVLALLDNDKDKLQAIAESKWPEGYWSVRDVSIVAIPKNKPFRVREYDGNESIEFLNNDNYITF